MYNCSLGGIIINFRVYVQDVSKVTNSTQNGIAHSLRNLLNMNLQDIPKKL